MKFHGYFRSSAAHRVRIALNLKGIAPALAYVHLRKGEQRGAAYAALNPQALVPALEVDGPDGPAAIAQSMAILEYLEETHPGVPLLPRHPLARARVRSLALICVADVHPLQNLRVLAKIRNDYGQDEAASFAWARHWNEVGLTAYETSVSGHRDTGRFSHGDAPGIADCCLVPQVFSAKRFGVDLGRFPTVGRIFDSCQALPAFDLAQPSKQPDAEP